MITWKRVDWLALAIAMAFPSIMSWLEFLVLPDEGGEQSLAMQWAFGLGKGVQFSFPIFYLRWRLGHWAWPTNINRRGLGWGIAFGLLVAAGTLILYFTWLRYTPALEDTPRRVHDWLSKFKLAHPAGYLSMAFFMAILHSFLEEYYFRWFIFDRLKTLLPVPGAVVLSGLAFMSHHVVILSVYMKEYFWEAAVPFSLCVAGGGFVWAWLYHRYQSLSGPWASHLLVDAALMGLGYDMLAPYW